MVAKNGKIEDVKVVRSGGHPLLDKEAIRVLRSMPKWIPGKKRGEPVRVKYTIPVNFALE
jgi:protein TonB